MFTWCSPSWPQILCVASDGFELLTVLPPPTVSWDYRHAEPQHIRCWGRTRDFVHALTEPHPVLGTCDTSVNITGQGPGEVWDGHELKARGVAGGDRARKTEACQESSGCQGEERFCFLLGRSSGACSHPGETTLGEIRSKGSENIPGREGLLFGLGSARRPVWQGKVQAAQDLSGTMRSLGLGTTRNLSFYPLGLGQ